MAIETRAPSDKPAVFALCEEMGEAAVLADLERAGVKFMSEHEKWLAWEWVYGQRLKREQATEEALRATARQTMRVAIATFFVALFTAGLLLADFFFSR